MQSRKGAGRSQSMYFWFVCNGGSVILDPVTELEDEKRRKRKKEKREREREKTPLCIIYISLNSKYVSKRSLNWKLYINIAVTDISSICTFHVIIILYNVLIFLCRMFYTEISANLVWIWLTCWCFRPKKYFTDCPLLLFSSFFVLESLLFVVWLCCVVFNVFWWRMIKFSFKQNTLHNAIGRHARTWWQFTVWSFRNSDSSAY